MKTKHCHWFSLKGETIIEIDLKIDKDKEWRRKDEVTLKTASGRVIRLSHYQDCCETVNVVKQSVPTVPFGPIVLAEEDNPSDPDWYKLAYDDSHTWTRFRAVSESGAELDLWWLGESNGYYSETVDVEEVV